MMSCGLCSTLIVSVVVLGQLFSISYSKSEDIEDPSEIFHKYHTAVVTVVTDIQRGTGFSIDPKVYLITGTETKIRFVITAFHVVKGADRVGLYLYQDEKDDQGNWKKDICPAEIWGFDIVRDIALLYIACDTCDCTRLEALQTRLSTVNAGETILVIGDSAKRRPHSFVDGKLSDANFTVSLMSLNYKQLDKDIAATPFVSRVHGLIGSVYLGDSGSAVMDISGNVIGMIVAKHGDLNYCVTMEEISKARVKILDTLMPRFVACTAHESALLGRTYWGDRSGKSINEMNALATATNAQYFAVAHDGMKAHAFTFHALWWEILPGDDDMKEDASQCICEMTSFTDGQFLRRTKDGKVMCGCSENSCRRNPAYQKRFGEDNDRRWAVYKRMSRNPDKSRHYIPSEESLALMKNIAGEITYWKRQEDIVRREKEKLVSSVDDIAHANYYWKQKADILRIEKEKLVSEYKSIIAIVIAVAICVASSFVSLAICLYNHWKNTIRMLKKTNAEPVRLKEQLYTNLLMPD